MPDSDDPDNGSSGADPDDFPHESLEIPGWVQVLTGLILIALFSAAIWKGWY